MPDDGLGRGPDHVRFFQLFAARDGYHRQFRREPFHVLGFLLQKTFRDEQREVQVLMARGLEAPVQLALQHFPHGIAVGLDDHTTLDDFGGFRHVPREDDILIPRGKVLAARSDRRFSHMIVSLIF